MLLLTSDNASRTSRHPHGQSLHLLTHSSDRQGVGGCRRKRRQRGFQAFERAECHLTSCTSHHCLTAQHILLNRSLCCSFPAALEGTATEYWHAANKAFEIEHCDVAGEPFGYCHAAAQLYLDMAAVDAVLAVATCSARCGACGTVCQPRPLCGSC